MGGADTQLTASVVIAGVVLAGVSTTLNAILLWVANDLRSRVMRLEDLLLKR